MSKDVHTANAIINLRVCKDTKRGYGGIIRNVILYLLSNRYTNYVNGQRNEISQPLSYEAIKWLFGWLSTNTDLPRNAKKKSDNLEVVLELLSDDDEDEDEDENASDSLHSGNVLSAFGNSEEVEVDMTIVTLPSSCMQVTLSIFTLFIVGM